MKARPAHMRGRACHLRKRCENGQGPNYDVTRDGRFLINTVIDEAPARITLLQNWNPSGK